jgi:hypothetical protein
MTQIQQNGSHFRFCASGKEVVMWEHCTPSVYDCEDKTREYVDIGLTVEQLVGSIRRALEEQESETPLPRD